MSDCVSSSLAANAPCRTVSATGPVCSCVVARLSACHQSCLLVNVPGLSSAVVSCPVEPPLTPACLRASKHLPAVAPPPARLLQSLWTGGTSPCPCPTQPHHCACRRCRRQQKVRGSGGVSATCCWHQGAVAGCLGVPSCCFHSRGGCGASACRFGIAGASCCEGVFVKSSPAAGLASGTPVTLPSSCGEEPGIPVGDASRRRGLQAGGSSSGDWSAPSSFIERCKAAPLPAAGAEAAGGGLRRRLGHG